MPQRSLGTVVVCLLLASAISKSARAEGATREWPRVEVVAPQITGLPKLEMHAAEWKDVSCVFPCVTRLDPSLEYRVSGDGVVDSESFRLPAGADRVRLDVSTGSTMLRDMGAFLAIGGLVFVAGGGTVLLLPNRENATHDEKTSKTVVGIGMLSLGAVTAAVGILVRVLSDTSVKVSTVAPATAEAR